MKKKKPSSEIIKKNYGLPGKIGFVWNCFQSVLSEVLFGFLSMYLFDVLLYHQQKVTVYFAVALFAAVYFILAVPAWGYLMEKGTNNVRAAMTRYLVESYFTDKKVRRRVKHSSVLLAVLQDDIRKAAELCGWNLVVLIQAVISGVVSVVIFVNLSGSITLILIVAGVGVVVCSMFVAGRVHRYSVQVREKTEKRLKLMLEYINNIVPVRLYHVEDDYLDRMDALSAEICRLQKRMDAIQIWTDSFQDFIFQAFYRLIIIAVGLYDYQRGNISLGSIMFMLSMSEGLAFCISSLGGYIRKVQEILVSREKFDKLGRRDNPGHLGETELTHIETIEFRNVGFMYADSKDKVFEKVNLLFQRGEDYRIVGDNGSGKSTLLKLMFGLYETETGKILVNGTDSSADVYGRIVYVPQEPDIFGETLRYNLLVDHTEIQMEEIERALQTVELFAWYSTLPERLDTMLKEKGKNISKGQKARIAVARALLNQPDFIVMDEIDANIDASMVQRLMENVRINYPDCSIVAVTHRGEGDVYMDFRVLRVAKKRVEVCQV